MKQYSVQDVLDVLGGAGDVVGNPAGKYFTGLKPVFQASETSLVYVSVDRKDKQQLVEQTKAQIVMCDPAVELADEIRETKCLIRVKDPKLMFIRIGNALFKPKPVYGVHPTAYIHPEAVVHPKTMIGPFTYLGKCEVGEGTIIYGHVYVYDDVHIGKNVVIHAGCILGSEGLGHLRNESGEYDEQFPHLSGVVIEDDVEVMANTVIDRGCLGDTIIGKGVKIDSLVLVGHNDVVGKHTGLGAHSLIAGSIDIGEYTWVAPSSTLRDWIKIGDHVLIGLGSVVTKDVPPGETWVGSPARPIDEFLAIQGKLKNMTKPENKE